MINNKFNRKLRRLLSVSCLGALCYSQVIYAGHADSLRSTSQEFRKELFNHIERDLEYGNKTGVRRWLRRSRDLLVYKGKFSPKDTGDQVGRENEKRTNVKIAFTLGLFCLSSIFFNESSYNIVYQDNTISSPIKIILLKADDKVMILPYNKTISQALESFFKERDHRLLLMYEKERKNEEKLEIEEFNKRYKKQIENLKIPNDIENIAWNKGNEEFKKSLMQVLSSKTSKIIKYGIPFGLAAAVISFVAVSKSSQINHRIIN